MKKGGGDRCPCTVGAKTSWGSTLSDRPYAPLLPIYYIIFGEYATIRIDEIAASEEVDLHLLYLVV